MYICTYSQCYLQITIVLFVFKSINEFAVLRVHLVVSNVVCLSSLYGIVCVVLLICTYVGDPGCWSSSAGMPQLLVPRLCEPRGVNSRHTGGSCAGKCGECEL